METVVSSHAEYVSELVKPSLQVMIAVLVTRTNDNKVKTNAKARVLLVDCNGLVKDVCAASNKFDWPVPIAVLTDAPSPEALLGAHEPDFLFSITATPGNEDIWSWEEQCITMELATWLGSLYLGRHRS